MDFFAVNLQVSMGAVGLKMLALKETNISHHIFGGKQNLGLIMSSTVSKNVSLQIENSTNYSQHYDSGKSIEESKNVSLEIGNSTSEQNDWDLSTKGSKNASLQVENSTSPNNSYTPTIPLSSIGQQHAETTSKNS